LARLLGHGATLITTDLIKCGALEQAAAYAKALSARVVQMPDPAALDDLLRQCPSDHFVVIDTVGINPFSEDELGQLSAHGKEVRPDKLLVLPGGGDALESAEAALAFAGAGARLLIASKLDLVRRLGGILAAAHAGKLALTAIGISPNIGGGLRPVNPMSLARLLLSGLERAEHRSAMV
jgi:flagellar biosynthesis protein FlhF